MPELAPTPLTKQLRIGFLKGMNFVRVIAESLLTEATVFFPWLGGQAAHVYRCGERRGEKLAAHFTSEVWVGGMLILLTLALVIL